MLDDSPEVFPTLDLSTIEKLLPQNVLKFGETVGHLSVLQLGKGPQFYEEVLLSDTYSPSFFWIHLRKNIPKFESFMNQLHLFYEDQNSKYRIPSIALKKGLNVVCKFESKWHRGIIKSVLPDGHSFIHFYDYGTVENYKPEELCFLHERFSSLPAQAILCSLYNVKPTGTQWQKQTIFEFISKTSEPLIATITTKNVEENSMNVCLIDTKGEDDFDINDWMLENNLALKGNFSCNKNRNFPFSHYVKCLEEKGYNPSIICNMNFDTKVPIRNTPVDFNNSIRIESQLSSQESLSRDSFVNKNNQFFTGSGEMYEDTYKRNQMKAQEWTKNVMRSSLLPRTCPAPTNKHEMFNENIFKERNDDTDFNFVKDNSKREIRSCGKFFDEAKLTESFKDDNIKEKCFFRCLYLGKDKAKEN